MLEISSQNKLTLAELNRAFQNLSKDNLISKFDQEMVKISASKVEKTTLFHTSKTNQKLASHVLQLLKEDDIVNLQEICHKRQFRKIPFVDKLAEKFLLEVRCRLKPESLTSCLGIIINHAVYQTKARQLACCMGEARRIIMPTLPQKQMVKLRNRILKSKIVQKSSI